MQQNSETIVEMLSRYPFGEAPDPRSSRILVRLNRRFKAEEAEELRSKVEFHSKLHHPSLVTIVKAFQSNQARFFDIFFEYVPKGLRQCCQSMTRQQLQLLKNQLRDLCGYLIGMNIYPEVAEELIGVDSRGNAKLYLDVDFRVLKPKQNKGELVKVKYVEIQEVVGQYQRHLGTVPASQREYSPTEQRPTIGTTNNNLPIGATNLPTSRSHDPLIRFHYVSPARTRGNEALQTPAQVSPRNETQSRFVFTDRRSHPLPNSQQTVNLIPITRPSIQSVSPQARSVPIIGGTQVYRRVSINPQQNFNHQSQQQIYLSLPIQQQSRNTTIHSFSRMSLEDPHSMKVDNPRLNTDSRQVRFNSDSRNILIGRPRGPEPVTFRTEGTRVLSGTETRTSPIRNQNRNDTPIRRLDHLQKAQNQPAPQTKPQEQVPKQVENQTQKQSTEKTLAQTKDQSLQPQPSMSSSAPSPNDNQPKAKESEQPAAKSEEQPIKPIPKLPKLISLNDPSPTVSQPDSPRDGVLGSSNQGENPEKHPLLNSEPTIREATPQEVSLHTKFSHGLPAIAKTISQSVMLNDEHIFELNAHKKEHILHDSPSVPMRQPEPESKKQKSSKREKPKVPSIKLQRPNLPPKKSLQNLLHQYQEPRHQPPIVINIISPSEHDGNKLIEFARSITEHSLDTYYAELGDALQMPRIKITELRQTTQSPPKLPQPHQKIKLHESVGISNGKALLDRRNEVQEVQFDEQSPATSNSRNCNNPFKRKVNRLDRIPDEPESPTEAVEGFNSRHNSNSSHNRRNCLYQMAQNYLAEPNRQPYEEDSEYGKADYRLVNVFPPPQQPDNLLAKQLNNLFDQEAQEYSQSHPQIEQQSHQRRGGNQTLEEELVYEDQHQVYEEQEQLQEQEVLESQQPHYGEQPSQQQEQHYEEQNNYEPQQYSQQNDNDEHYEQQYQPEGNSQQYYEQQPDQVTIVNITEQRRPNEQRSRPLKASDSTCQADLQPEPIHFPRVKNDEINQRVMQALKKSEAMLDFFNKFKQRKLQAEQANND